MKPADEHLIVMDDERDICTFVKEVAESVGFTVSAPDSVGEFKTLVEDLKPALIVLDLQMPEADGVELMRYLASRHHAAAIVLMSGTDRKILDTARRVGEYQGLKIAAVLQKPMMPDELLPILCSHIANAPAIDAGA